MITPSIRTTFKTSTYEAIHVTILRSFKAEAEIVVAVKAAVVVVEIAQAVTEVAKAADAPTPTVQTVVVDVHPAIILGLSLQVRRGVAVEIANLM